MPGPPKAVPKPGPPRLNATPEQERVHDEQWLAYREHRRYVDMLHRWQTLIARAMYIFNTMLVLSPSHLTLKAMMGEDAWSCTKEGIHHSSNNEGRR